MARGGEICSVLPRPAPRPTDKELIRSRDAHATPRTIETALSAQNMANLCADLLDLVRGRHTPDLLLVLQFAPAADKQSGDIPTDTDDIDHSHSKLITYSAHTHT